MHIVYIHTVCIHIVYIHTVCMHIVYIHTVCIHIVYIHTVCIHIVYIHTVCIHIIVEHIHNTRLCSQIGGMMLYLIEFRFKAVYSKEQGVVLQVLAVLVTTVPEILLRDELSLPPAINR